MEIKANCKFDKDAIKALTHVSLYKISNPKKAVLAKVIMGLLIIIFCVAHMIVLGFDYVSLVLIALPALVIFGDFYCYFFLPKKQY